MEIISQEIHNDLVKIYQVRNEMAHFMNKSFIQFEGVYINRYTPLSQRKKNNFSILNSRWDDLIEKYEFLFNDKNLAPRYHKFFTEHLVSVTQTKKS